MTNNLSTVAVYPKLNDDWNVYYHLQNDKCWDLSSYKLIMTLQNVYDVIFINDRMPDIIIKHCILFVMRKGITLRGGFKEPVGRAFSFKVYNKTSLPSGRNCVICCAGSRWSATARYKNVNGISISPKRISVL
jgi:hypothetical protein